jgi:hypothetical protein
MLAAVGALCNTAGLIPRPLFSGGCLGPPLLDRGLQRLGAAQRSRRMRVSLWGKDQPKIRGVRQIGTYQQRDYTVEVGFAVGHLPEGPVDPDAFQPDNTGGAKVPAVRRRCLSGRSRRASGICGVQSFSISRWRPRREALAWR